MSDLFPQILERLSSQTAPRADVVAIVTSVPAPDPAHLVSAYTGDLALSFWHAAPRPGETSFALVGFGEAVRIEGQGPERTRQIAQKAAQLYRSLSRERTSDLIDAPGPFFLGGLSFRPNSEGAPWKAFADASFSLPRWTYVRKDERAWLWLCVRKEELDSQHRTLLDQWAVIRDALQAAEQGTHSAASGASIVKIDVADRDAYCALVTQAIASIRSHETDKIVAVASSHITFDKPIDTRSVLQRLGQAYPDTTRFAIQRDERVFVGASPERLVALQGRHVDSDALAGTARRLGDDAVVTKNLLSSTKDRQEHALVVDSIAAVLGPHCSALDIPNEPRMRTLRNVHHLWTPIRGVLRNETHILDLVHDLHPTPAVAGTPRDRATAWIAKHEATSRGWYTGTVGYFDAVGDGEFAVAIRAGLVGKYEAFLYAGAGIVEASDPPAEYAEIRAKEAPMLSALGISP